MPNSREKLYNAISSKYDLGTFDEFNKKMDNADSRKKLYGAISADFDLGSFDEFEVKIGQPEKKKSLDFGSELPYGKTTFNAPSPSIKNTSPSKSVSPLPIEEVTKKAAKELTPETMDVPVAAVPAIKAERQAEKDLELKKQMVYNDMRYARLLDKQQAKERGYEKVDDYYKDRETYLINNFLTNDDKEEARAQNAFAEAKKIGNEAVAAEELQNLLNTKAKFRQTINAEKQALDSEEEQLKQSLESGMPQEQFDGAMKVLANKRANLDLMTKPYYDPKKSMSDFLQGNVTEVAAVAKPSQTAKEKLQEYTNALYTQLNIMRDDLGWDADNGALDAYAKDFQLRREGKGELVDKMYETELKLRNAVKILELNRTPIENETALGVFGKSFATSINPASASKQNTEQIVAQNLQSINEDAGISEAVDKEQKKFAEENAKEYKPYSAKWFAQPAGTSAAIMLEFIPATMATEGAFAATKIGRLVNIAEQYGKVKGLNTTQKYLNAINKYKTLKAADTIGKFAIKTQANGLKFGSASEAVATLFPKEADQVNFTTGYFGGQIGKGAEQLLGGAATSLYKLFGNKAPEAAKAIERLGEQFKFAKDAPKVILGEIGEEFGESLGQIYKESDSWKEISAKLDEQFGTLDKATQFVIQTGIMALGMGGGSAIGTNLMKASKDAYNKLSREQRATVDEVLDSVSEEETKVVEDATKEVSEELKKEVPQIKTEINEITDELQQPNQLSPTDVGQQLETTTTDQSNVGNLEGTGGELTGVDSSVQESEPIEGSIVNEPKTSIDEAQKTENLQTESEPISNVGEVNGQEPTVPTKSEGLPPIRKETDIFLEYNDNSLNIKDGKEDFIEHIENVKNNTDEDVVRSVLPIDVIRETEFDELGDVSDYKEEILSGIQAPIVIEYDKNTGDGVYFVEDGHHRLKAYTELGYKEIPVVVNESGVKSTELLTTESQAKPLQTEVESKAITEPTKAERKKLAEAKIDEIADALKEFLPSVKGVKKQGASQDAIIDLVAKAVKTLVNTGIEIDEAIKRVRTLLEDKFDTSDVKDFDIKMNLAKEELQPELEKFGISYKQAVFTVNKYLREVGKEDTITKDELSEALKNKEAGEEREGYEAPKSKKNTTEESGKTKNRKHYETMMAYVQNLPETVQAYFKDNPMGYEELSNATLLKESIEYIKKQGVDKEGNPNAYEKYMSGDVAKELSEAHEVAVGFLIRGALSNQYTELVKELKDNPKDEGLQKQIESLFDKTIALAKRLGEEGTSYGRAVQAYSLFAQNLTDEISALFYFGKMVEKMAAAAKKQQSSKTKEYKEKANKTISKGKKEAAKETAEYAIKKYKAKPKDSERVKQYKQEAKEAADKLKDAFSKYRNVGVFYNGWEEAKKDIEVMKALRDYVKAQAKYKAVQVQQIIKEVADLLGIDSNLIDKETISEIITTAKKDTESEKVLETAEKEKLKRIQNEQKELGKTIKELEDKTVKLGKEIVNSPSLTQEAFEGIIEDYYTGNQSTEELEKLIKSRFDVTDAQAKDLAVKLKNSINTNVREKLIKQMGREVEKAEKKLKEEPPKDKKERKDVYQLLIEAHMMGVLNDDAIQDIISPMFRIPKMTQEDIAFVKDTMNKYLETGDKVRKAELIGKMIKNFNNKSPLSLYQAYDSMWYAMVLSGFSTIDVNLIFGEQILKVAAIEYSALQFGKAIVKALKSKTEGRQAAIRALYGYYRMLFQAGNKTPKQMLNIKSWNEGDIPLTETYANVRSVLANGNEVFMQELKDVYYNTKTDTDLRDLSKKQSGLWYNILSGMNIFQKGVPRLLNAIDLVFSTPVKNLFLVPVLEEHYAKQGLKGEELTKAIENDIFNTEERVLEAKAKAKKDRMMIDITIEEKNGKWIVRDEGATFIKSKTLDTEKEAKDYADKIASEGVKYQKGVLDYLNNRLPSDSIKTAKRIASRYLLTSEPEGTLGGLYDKWVTPFKITRQQGYLNPDNNWLKRGIDFTLDKMVVFLRVPFNMFNLAVDATPAGFFRYSNGRILSNYKRLEYSQVEKNLVLTRALIGTATLSALLFKQLLIQEGGDDDEKEKEKKQKLVDSWNEMYPNNNLNIKNPLFNLPQDGEIIGSLDMLDPLRKKFLIDNNLAKPFSIYDAKTNSWKSYMTDINFISMAIISSQSNYNKYIINDETRFTTTAQKKKEWSEVAKFFWANFSGVMLNLSGLKNQQKAAQSLSNAPQAVDKFVDVALSGIQTTPAIIKQMVQNYDGFLRERVSITKDPETYLAQKVIPIGGAFFLGEKMYDMHGEEMPFVYGSQNGGILGYVFNKMYGEKEKQRLELANWYNLNGYTRFRDFAKEMANKTVVSKVGDEYLDTPLFTDDKELKKYGLEAAKLAKETVLKKRTLLQKLANIDTSKMPYKKESYKLPFSKGVDALFSAAYRLTWMKAAYEKGKITKDLYEIEKEKFKMIGDNLERIAETTKFDVEELNNEKTLIEDLLSFGYISE